MLPKLASESSISSTGTAASEFAKSRSARARLLLRAAPVAAASAALKPCFAELRAELREEVRIPGDEVAFRNDLDTLRRVVLMTAFMAALVASFDLPVRCAPGAFSCA